MMWIRWNSRFALFVLGAMTVYVPTYMLVYGILGNSAGILATVPVIAAAWLFRLRGGLLATLLFFVVHSWLVILNPERSWSEWLEQGGGLGSGALLLVGSMFGWMRELKDRANLEAANHRHSEARLRAIMDNVAEAIITLDEQYIVLSGNAAFLKIFGFSAAEIIGRNISALIPDFYDGQRNTHDAKDLGVGGDGNAVSDLESEIEGRRKDGSTFPIELTCSVFFHGKSRMCVVVVRDITEQKLLQSERLHSQKMEAIRQLAGGVAHDFTNMLSVITINSHLIESTLPSRHPINSYVEEIKTATTRSNHLSSQLLTFSRKQANQPRVVDLNGLILDIERMLRSLMWESIDLVFQLSQRPLPVELDPVQMEQVLVSMVMNARDAIPESGKIVIKTSHIDIDHKLVKDHFDAAARKHVMISIADNGIGMSDEVKQRIFDPFFTTKSVGKGTGLGLSTSFGVVTQIGGQITVDSSLGNGTTFKIYLPLAKEMTESLTSPDDSSHMARGCERVLVVEDEQKLRMVVVSLLREQGYDVYGASNGAEALQLIENGTINHVDIVVTDLVMPVMGGRKFAERLRELRPESKLLYISGYADDPMIYHDGTPLLQKPFTPFDLVRNLRSALDA